MWKHAVPGALSRRRILDREQYRASPLAAKTQPLPEAKEREQRRRGHADGPVSRQRANSNRGDPHREERSNQRRFAPNAIAEVAEEGRANGPREERNRKSCERS